MEFGPGTPPVTVKALLTVASAAVQYVLFTKVVGTLVIAFAFVAATLILKTGKSILFNKLPNSPDLPGSPPGNPNA